MSRADYVRGAEWRKWDLHFHTPASGKDYHKQGLSNQQLVNCWRENGLSLVAITDHFIIDLQLIEELQSLAGPDITVLPGIELRSELGGHTSVHFIGVFPEDCRLDEVWMELQTGLALRPSDIEARGVDRLYQDFREASELIHRLGGVVTVHAGRKSNSIEKIPNVEQFRQALKADLMRDCIDLIELGQPRDADGYQRIVFPGIGFERPLILCSDNHDATDYTVKQSCWYKADPTFQGLRQVLREPDRVFIGDTPAQLREVELHATRFIDLVTIGLDPDQTPIPGEKWFDVAVPLNPGLVAVVGNKGSGKSALADVIGLVGATENSKHFSFLSSSKFRQARQAKAKHFRGSIRWHSGDSSGCNLAEDLPPESVRTVRYIPQNLLESICAQVDDSGFRHEIEQTLFSHIPEHARLGKASLSELISFHTETTHSEIGRLTKQLSLANEEIVSLETRLHPSYRLKLERLRDQKQAELGALEARKPTQVAKPDQLLPEAARRIHAALGRLERVQAWQATHRQLTTETERRVAELSLLREELGQVLERLRLFEQAVEDVKHEMAEPIKRAGLELDQILMVQITPGPVETKCAGLDAEILASRRRLDASDRYTVAGRLLRADSLVVRLNAALDEPNRVYQQYQSALAEWEKGKTEVAGSPEREGTLQSLEHQIEQLDAVPARLMSKRDERLEIVRAIFSKKRDLQGRCETLYRPVQQFVDSHPLISRELGLNFSVPISETGFSEGFFGFVSHGVSGSFCGKDQGTQRLGALLQATNFSEEESVISFVTEVCESLHADRRAVGQSRSPTVAEQLRSAPDNTPKSLYDYLFSLSYLAPSYQLRKGDLELSRVSPGERGELLLVFYLLVDQDRRPLVIDQPEENLDNQTIYSCLVPCIREAKTRRQIIVVTHNPNLAVVSDAEQIVYAEHNRAGDRAIRYEAGSIENPRMNKHIVDVLEGTRPAFDDRNGKYFEDQNSPG